MDSVSPPGSITQLPSLMKDLYHQALNYVISLDLLSPVRQVKNKVYNKEDVGKCTTMEVCAQRTHKRKFSTLGKPKEAETNTHPLFCGSLHENVSHQEHPRPHNVLLGPQGFDMPMGTPSIVVSDGHGLHLSILVLLVTQERVFP